MYDIRQFRPTLYLLVLLSVAGFSLAAETPGLWIVATSAILLNAWVVRRGTFRPMPRLLANLVTILPLFFVIQQVITTGGAAVLLIGEFLMLMQVVMLWGQRGNRDYAQLLVLSLLLMVAAAISTASIVFGLLLVIFLFLALYCCLLFHLKTETDAARETLGAAARKVSSATLKQDQRYFMRSMRKLTLLVSLASIFWAAFVFILFPRGAGGGVFRPLQFQPTQALVGFTDDVSFQNIARIQQSEAQVGTVKLIHNDQVVTDGRPIYLRGVTLDLYTGKEGGYRWVRWPRSSSHEAADALREKVESTIDDDPRIDGELTRELSSQLLGVHTFNQNQRWVQQIQMQPTGTDVMFAMAGAFRLSTAKPPLTYRYWLRDSSLRNVPLRERGAEMLNYEVTSSADLGDMAPPAQSGTDPQVGGVIAREIRDYAQLPEVCGVNDAKKSLGAIRYAQYLATQQNAAFPMAAAAPDPADEQIATNIERHLRSHFEYSTDLTDTRRIEGRDPMVAFLYDFKRGHCEYFAGAMTLLCQSLGMKARMVCGFRSEDFNATPGAGWYIIRQSHAHAWVEVFTVHGWKSFDPTSERDSAVQLQKNGFMQRLKHLFNFLEFNYGKAIIGYSNEDRVNVFQSAEGALYRATLKAALALDTLRHGGIPALLSSKLFWNASTELIALLVFLTGMAVIALVGKYLFDKWELRRRAARIGIGSLPMNERLRMAQQLKFYDDLMMLLGDRQIIRQRHQTPLEFSQSLLYLPSTAYERIRRLTDLFYKVRYGQRELTPARQRHLSCAIARLKAELQEANLQ